MSLQMPSMKCITLLKFTNWIFRTVQEVADFSGQWSPWPCRESGDSANLWVSTPILVGIGEVRVKRGCVQREGGFCKSRSLFQAIS